MLIAVVLGLGCASLPAQNLPVKMGLWEKTIVSSTGEGSPTTVTAKSCLTPQVWQQMMANAQKPQNEYGQNREWIQFQRHLQRGPRLLFAH
jgi:hypothetical protein